MCIPSEKSLSEDKSDVPEDILEITEIPSHNEENIDGYIVCIDGQEIIYFTTEEAYQTWLQNKNIEIWQYMLLFFSMSGFLVDLAKGILGQIEEFITEWDGSDDKATYVSTIGRFIKTSKPELYQKIQNHLKITDEAINNLTVYLIEKHSGSHGQDLSAKANRITAMVDFMIEKFFMVCVPLIDDIW